ncbi:MAG: 3-hydroxyacyl-ACP dehydratase FabZ [Myxococcales bacterium]|nr:3-hydroxyacyl-ACP dehydratase FabZ [Myxococcales bacterium]
MDISVILRALPHRYPFLLVDRVVDYSADGERCVAIKNVTINEPFFVGHFPGHPVMPGVLMLEAMAQTSALHARLKLGDLTGERIVYLMGIDRAKFRKPVVPGDRLELHSTLLRGGGRIWKFRGEAKVGDQKVAEAEYMATLAGAGAEDAAGPDAGPA